MSARRVYKAAIPHDRCVEIIRQEAGKQFDPRIVEAFLLIADDFQHIRERYIEVQMDVLEKAEPLASRCREHAEAMLTAESERVLLSILSTEDDSDQNQFTWTSTVHGQ
ncbi:hypothetical protein GC163_06785 [bacterium]|nr:hypothetical protein [bacterium]